MIEAHMVGRQAYGREIWSLLTLELWHRLYIDHFDYAEAAGQGGGACRLAAVSRH